MTNNDALESRDDILKTAQAAAKAGAEVVARYFREGVTIRSKSHANLVSDADLHAEQAIVAAIQARFPEHAILGEEEQQADVNAERLWVVDPLDGTNNFAHHMPHFAVSIAYWERGVPVCGVITNPVRDDWFECTRGGGAFYNGEKMHVGEQASLAEVFVGCGFYYDRGAMMESTLSAIRDFFGQQIHGIRRCGTASLDLCFVGMGCYGSYFEYQLSPWDFAAGQLFVQEAGGTVTNCQGNPLKLEVTSVLASNRLLHNASLEIVQKYHP